MRRTADAPNGVMEFMVAELMTWSATTASSGFPELRCAPARLCTGRGRGGRPLERVSSRLLGLDHFWQLQRLYRANAKYHPKWRPLSLAVASLLTVPGVARAAAWSRRGFLPGWFAKAHSAGSDAVARLSPGRPRKGAGA